MQRIARYRTNEMQGITKKHEARQGSTQVGSRGVCHVKPWSRTSVKNRGKRHVAHLDSYKTTGASFYLKRRAPKRRGIWATTEGKSSRVEVELVPHTSLNCLEERR